MIKLPQLGDVEIVTSKLIPTDKILVYDGVNFVQWDTQDDYYADITVTHVGGASTSDGNMSRLTYLPHHTGSWVYPNTVPAYPYQGPYTYPSTGAGPVFPMPQYDPAPEIEGEEIITSEHWVGAMRYAFKTDAYVVIDHTPNCPHCGSKEWAIESHTPVLVVKSGYARIMFMVEEILIPLALVVCAACDEMYYHIYLIA